MNEEDQDQNSTEVNSTGSSDVEFELMMAEHIWQVVKGLPIPDDYSVEDRMGIFARYYHRAVAKSQGE